MGGVACAFPRSLLLPDKPSILYIPFVANILYKIPGLFFQG